MRTLSAGLLAAQQAGSIKPSVRSIACNAPVIYGPTRIVHARMVERPLGSVLYLQLRNDDLAYNADDYRGNTVELRWGATYGLGPTTEWSLTQPFFVANSQWISIDGELLLELICIDTWQYLSMQKILGGGGTKLTGTITGVLIPGTRVTGQTSGATGIVNSTGDGYVGLGHVSTTHDFTTEVVSSDRDATNYITVSAVAEFGGGSNPVWPADTTILAIIQSLCSGICTVTLDSSDGIVNVRMPYYEAPTGESITNVIKDLMSLTKCGYRFEDDYALHIFDCSTEPSPVDYTYELGGDHAFDGNTRETAAVLPNRIICVSVDYGASDITDYSGSADDLASQSRWSAILGNGIVTDIIWQRSSSNAECTDYAESRLLQINREAYKGEFTCPIMNVGQELFDYVEVINPIDGVTSYGWVGMIERTWDEKTSEYGMKIGLGNLVARESLPPGIPYDPTPPNNPPDQPIPDTPLPNWDMPEIPDYEVNWEDLPKAIQGYHTDVIFSAVDWDTVQWSSGTIQFYDGTTQAIAAGNTGNLTAGIKHIYFDLSSGTPNVLIVTTNYLSVFDEFTGILCLVQRGSGVGVMPTIIPSYGKEPLITADVIWLTGMLDLIQDAGGNNYSAVLSTYLQAGRILLSETAGDLDDIDDGTSWSKVATADIQSGHIKLSTVIQEAGYRTVTDTNKNYWSAKPNSMDDIPQGASWMKIAYTEIESGHIKLETTYQTSLYRTVTDTQKSSWTSKPENMDEIGEGVEWKRVLASNIDSGNLKITAASVFAGEWYNESGVTIDAVNGIDIYGVDGALTTRAYDGGPIQCKVTNLGAIYAGAGKVLLDASGMKITDQGISFYQSTTLRGYIKGYSSKMYVMSSSGNDLYLDGAANLILSANTGEIIFNANAKPIGIGADFGSITIPWRNIFVEELWFEGQTYIVYDDFDDIQLLRQIDSNPDGTVRVESFPESVKRDGKYLSSGKMQMLLIGAIKQLADEVDKLKERLCDS